MAKSSQAEKRRRRTELNVEEAEESSEELNVEEAEESSEDLADVEKRLLLFSIALYLKRLSFPDVSINFSLELIFRFHIHQTSIFALEIKNWLWF